MAASDSFFTLDRDLQRLLGGTALDDEDRARLSAFGAWVADEVDTQAEYTDRFAPPVLETLDLDGRAVTRVRHNPLHAAAHREVYRRGIVGLNYGARPKPYVLTFAMGYLLAQADISLHCPVTLTGAVAYVLSRHAPQDVRARYLEPLVRMDGTAHTGGTCLSKGERGFPAPKS